MHACATEVKTLQEVVKVYLMLVGGNTDRLGGLACSLVDVLEYLCDDDKSKAAKQLEALSISTVKALYLSVVEALEEKDDLAAATHRKAQTRTESEVELLPHLLFLKSVLADFGIATKVDYSPVSQKLQELINGLKS